MAASWLAVVGYASLVGMGAYVIADVAENSARTATHAIDAAITQSADDAEISADPQSSLPRALRTANRIVATPVAESTAFEHARPAPRFVEQLQPQQVEELKQQVSERVVEEGSEPWHSGEQQTYRTMCVRLCDGAYFQVSYSTTRDRFQHDEEACAARCASPAKLFIQRNPGGSPETMKDRSGRSYVALPTAFQFRRAAVAGCSCRAQAWEQVSKDRHKLYALEQQQSEGKVVDVAEMMRLKEEVGAAATGVRSELVAVSAGAHDDGAKASASGAVAQVSALSARTAVSLIPVSSAAPITTAALPAEDVLNLDGAVAAGQGDSARAEKPVESEPLAVTAGAGKIAASHKAKSKVARKNAALAKKGKAVRQLLQAGVAPLPQSMRAVPSEDEQAVAEAEQQRTMTEKAARAGKGVKAGKALVAVKNDRIGGATKHVRSEKSGMTGGGPVGTETVRRKLPIEVAEKPIWGVGRNARHRPKGNSAFETFARNFY